MGKTYQEVLGEPLQDPEVRAEYAALKIESAIARRKLLTEYAPLRIAFAIARGKLFAEGYIIWPRKENRKAS